MIIRIGVTPLLYNPDALAILKWNDEKPDILQSQLCLVFRQELEGMNLNLINV